MPVSSFGYVLRSKKLTQPLDLRRNGLRNRNPSPEYFYDSLMTKKEKGGFKKR